MADVSERKIWKGGLWIGIFVNRDYCRFTSDCSPATYRPERISSLTKSRNVVWRDLLDSRNVVWRDLLDMALSEFINVAVSRQDDRWHFLAADNTGEIPS